MPGIMKVFAVFCLFAVAVKAADDFCYKDTQEACKPSPNKHASTLPNCNATYGAIKNIQGDLQKFANHQFLRSFDYLLMSTHFANYQKNRQGFEKLFRDLSDNLWSDSIDLIKYITSRGGYMDFDNVASDVKDEILSVPNVELYEIGAIAKALDIEKKLANEVFTIHREATRRREENHDPEISHHLENNYVHKHRDLIRKLSGYTNDLSTLLDGPDSSLSLYLFDEYLQKQ